MRIGFEISLQKPKKGARSFDRAPFVYKPYWDFLSPNN